MIESLVALPAFLFLLGLLISSLVVFGTRLHLVFVAQELATCSHSTLTAFECQSRAKVQGEKVLRQWGFGREQVLGFLSKDEGVLHVQGTFGPFALRWVLREKPNLAQ